jgi:ribose 1,5-bisphosphokinase PhnN
MAITEKPNFFVLSGGPGAGKTTLLRRLESMGELVVEESARAVIRRAAERPSSAGSRSATSPASMVWPRKPAASSSTAG